MRELLNRRDAAGLAANVVAVIVPVLLANVVVFGLGWDDAAPARVSFAPPGYVIGIVWVVLFTLMGAARWLNVRAEGEGADARSRLILILAVFCVLYPFYTAGLSSNVLGLAGNVATILLAAWVALRLAERSKAAGALVLPVVAWVGYATAIIVQEIQLGG